MGLVSFDQWIYPLVRPTDDIGGKQSATGAQHGACAFPCRQLARAGMTVGLYPL